MITGIAPPTNTAAADGDTASLHTQRPAAELRHYTQGRGTAAIRD